ncbi:zf-HC2 domain-containing protein [Clostridium sp. DL1XJH146]
MKKELECSIVQDLLPSYIEKLTSNDTNQAIENHLNNCVDCQNIYNNMNTEIIETVKAPVIELKFLKKVKRTRLLAAALCVILSLLLSYIIYDMEYKYSSDKADLSSAITEFMAFDDNDIDAYALETKEVDGVLLVSFKDQTYGNINGIAKFLKGFNQKYRIVEANVESSEYSSVVQFYPIEIKDKQYTAISAYNLSDDIKYYGLDFATYSSNDSLSEDRIIESLKIEVKNQQFLEIYETKELEGLLEKSMSQVRDNKFLISTSMYKSDGADITDSYRILGDDIQDVSFVMGKAELFLIYVYITIIIGLGIIMTRYFLTD